jgi:hypothetical protein
VIRVEITLHPEDGGYGKEKGRLEIEHVDDLGDYSNYTVKAAVERPNGDAALHNRMFSWARHHGNVLDLVYAALDALGPEAMRRDDEHDLER